MGPLKDKAHIIDFLQYEENLNVLISLFCSPIFTFQVTVSKNASKYNFEDDPYIIYLDDSLKKL